MTEEEQQQAAAHQERRLAAVASLLGEFSSRPGVSQIFQNPYIHGVSLATAFSAVLAFQEFAGIDYPLAHGVRAVTLAAVVSVVTVVVGLQWRDPIVGRGIESFGQLMLAAVWVSNISIIYFLPPGPQDTGWNSAMVAPGIFCLAALVRTLYLFIQTEQDKKALGVPAGIHRGVIGDGTG